MKASAFGSSTDVAMIAPITDDECAEKIFCPMRMRILPVRQESLQLFLNPIELIVLNYWRVECRND
jgi:hypothetical protein